MSQPSPERARFTVSSAASATCAWASLWSLGVSPCLASCRLPALPCDAWLDRHHPWGLAFRPSLPRVSGLPPPAPLPWPAVFLGLLASVASLHCQGRKGQTNFLVNPISPVERMKYCHLQHHGGTMLREYFTQGSKSDKTKYYISLLHRIQKNNAS